MQSRLPDINTAFNMHRRGVIEGIGSHNWDKVFGSLASWNGLLPKNMKDDGLTPKYRVTISDDDFDIAMEIKAIAFCTFENCGTGAKNKNFKGWKPTQIPFESIRVFQLVTTWQEQLLTDNKTNDVWVCPKCDREIRLSETVISESHLKEPYYLGIVPKPPRRLEGMQDRGSYARKVSRWAWNFIAELEEKTAAFREDYKENKQEFEAWQEETDSSELED